MNYRTLEIGKVFKLFDRSGRSPRSEQPDFVAFILAGNPIHSDPCLPFRSEKSLILLAANMLATGNADHGSRSAGGGARGATQLPEQSRSMPPLLPRQRQAPFWCRRAWKAKMTGGSASMILTSRSRGSWRAGFPHGRCRKACRRRLRLPPSARLGTNVAVGPFATIGENVVIGNNVTIFQGVSIEAGSSIGDDSIIYPNVVIYDGTRIGRRCIIHAGVVIGVRWLRLRHARRQTSQDPADRHRPDRG